MSSSDEAPRALYRFDPHDEGIWMGLGLVRLGCVLGALGLGAIAIYQGSIVGALLLMLVVPPIVLARWDGMPLVTWIPTRLAYRLQGPREWSIDPDLVGFATPAPAPMASRPSTTTGDTSMTKEAGDADRDRS